MKKILILINILIFVYIVAHIGVVKADEGANLVDSIDIEFFDEDGVINDYTYLTNNNVDDLYEFPINSTEMKVTVFTNSDLYSVNIWVNNENYGLDPYYDISDENGYYVEIIVLDETNEIIEEITIQLNRNTNPRTPYIDEIQWSIQNSEDIWYYPDNIQMTDSTINVEVPLTSDKLYLDYFSSDYKYSQISLLDQENNLYYGNSETVILDITQHNHKILLTSSLDGSSIQYEINFIKAADAQNDTNINTINMEFYDSEYNFIDIYNIECTENLFEYNLDIDENISYIHLYVIPKAYTTQVQFEDAIDNYNEYFLEVLNEDNIIEFKSVAENSDTSRYLITLRKGVSLKSGEISALDNGKKLNIFGSEKMYVILVSAIIIIIAIVILFVIVSVRRYKKVRK